MMNYEDFKIEKQKKDTYTLRMDVMFEKEMTYEEAEKRIYDGLRSVGMIGHRGGIS